MAIIAAAKGATSAQAALAWLLGRHPWIVPIPGTTKLHRLQENIAAADVALTAAELGELAGPTEGVGIGVQRYPEQCRSGSTVERRRGWASGCALPAGAISGPTGGCR